MRIRGLILGTVVVAVLAAISVWLEEKISGPEGEYVPTDREREVFDALRASNFCNQDEDCVILELGCPFHCFHLVHRSTVEYLKEKVGRYWKDGGNELCRRIEYSCQEEELMQPFCQNGVCVSPEKGEQS